MRERLGINNTHLKNRNRGLALQMIATEFPLSRIDISRRTGLTKMAVTNIVNEMIDEGFVVEKETAETFTVGRNPVILDISDTSPYAIGLYISRSQVSVIATNLKLNLCYQESTDLMNETSETLIEKLYTLTDRAIAYQKQNNPYTYPLGIGISAIGPLDSAKGYILNPRQFFNIHDLPIVSLIQNRYNIPVFLENDMNAAALAEKLFGSGKPYSNFIYMGITNGIGSGIITDGKLYQGTSGFVGEIGHISIKYDGELCDCGSRGCLELYANMPVILQKLREITQDYSILPQDFERLSKLDNCRKILDDMTDKLSIALTNAVNLFDPECIIIGHEGYYLPNKYLIKMQEYIQTHILSSGYKVIPVVASSFRDKAALYGSACTVLQKLFEGHVFSTANSASM